MITTKQLAEKYNTSMQAVRQSKYEKGHFKGYEPINRGAHKNGLTWGEPKSLQESVSSTTAKATN